VFSRQRHENRAAACLADLTDLEDREVLSGLICPNLSIVKDYFMAISRVVCLAWVAGLILGGNAALAATNLVSSDQQAASHPVVRAVEYLGQLVSQRTNGAVTVTVKSAGLGGSETESLRAVQAGRLAMTRVNLGLLGDQIPAAKLASMPYLFRSSAHMWTVLKGPFGQRLDSELAHAGYIRVMYMDSAPRDFYCMKPIRSLADFQGRKIRIMPSVVFSDLIQNLGAKPVDLPFNQIPDAFKSGKIDCAEGGMVNFVEAGHQKITPYLMQDEHLLIPEVLLMSKKIWDTLPAAQQQIFRTAAVESTDYMSKQWKDVETSALAATKKANVTVIARSQMSMTAIESQAIKIYSKYIRDPKDLETIMKIVTTK
jgi:TRAP-type transport system periplasmic protein